MLKKLLAPAAVALTALASTPASAAFEDFCVNSLAIAGTTATGGYNSLISGSNGCSTATQQGFTADKLNGGYSELLVVNATSDPNILSFQSTVFVNWGQFFRNNGSQQIGASSTLLGAQYDLYSVVRASGTLSLSTGQFNATNATAEVWADQFNSLGGANTSRDGWDFGLNPILSGAGDDELLLTGTFNSGAGQASAPGIFAFTFDNIALTALGNNYFIAPRPFYFRLLSDGDVDTEGFSVTAPGVFELAGDISANFYIPEPGSLALAGLALLGLGAVTRRKKQC